MKAPNGQLPKIRPDIRLYLFHGPDESGASELARTLAAGLPDSERVDLDAAALKRDPGRLADEAASLSLFGEAPLIRAAPIGEESLEAVTLLLDAERTGSPAIAVAPGVKASGKLVSLANGHPRALSIACYPPGAADLDRVVGTMLTDAGLRAAPGLARRLAEAASGDRSLIAREVEKLALFLDAAADRPRDAGTEALDAIGADDGETALGEAVEALVDGRPGELGTALARLDAGAASPIPWLRAVQRRLVALGDMRAAVDRGEPVEAVMKRHRIFFRDEARTAQELRRWSPARVAAALDRVRSAEREAVRADNAGAVPAERMAVEIARGIADRR